MVSLYSMPGMMWPAVRSRRWNGARMDITTMASVMPYPSSSGMPAASKNSSTASGSGPPPTQGNRSWPPSPARTSRKTRRSARANAGLSVAVATRAQPRHSLRRSGPRGRTSGSRPSSTRRARAYVSARATSQRASLRWVGGRPSILRNTPLYSLTHSSGTVAMTTGLTSGRSPRRCSTLL